ncbi:extracellular solute-binding protein [Halomarina rubra]|uniref:Extracellular solute-binding protein n=1 Tax=Halomarina rubra TaxID=2071873 RepID=A0ABD6ATJ5_9EURY|nr:extracellular solute-binding protein [Halomarina rubra]
MTADSRVDRRTVLAGLAGTLGGLGGCSGVLGRGGGSRVVSLLAAGSLNNALENGLRPSVDAPLAVEARGSAEAARLVAAGQKTPDVVSLADVALFDVVDAPWYAEFATNSLVVAYNPDTEGGRRVAAAGVEGWHRTLLRDDVALGRTDPDLDPLGYRTLFLFELANAYYDTDVDLRAAVPRDDQLYPETQLLAQFETGGIDAAVTYRNMAVERGYDFVDLPPDVDLGDPAFAERYATATYELPDGTVVSGGVVSYGSTVRRRSPAVDDVFRAHVTGRYLTEFGFVVPADYPRYTGDAPDALTV